MTALSARGNISDQAKRDPGMSLQILSDEDLNRIHEASLTVLEEYGIDFKNCQGAISILQNHGCVVRDGRVRFPKSLVKDALTQIPNRDSLFHFVPHLAFDEEISFKRGESHFGLIGNAYYIYDYEKGRSRDCRESDQEDKLLVMDSLCDMEFDCCNLFYHSERSGTGDARISGSEGTAVDYLRRWVQSRVGLDPAKLPAAHPRVTEEQKRLAFLGLAILEGSHERMQGILEKSDNAFSWCNPISPLQFHPDEARHIIDVARSAKRYRMVKISPEVMMGATGPVTIAGTLVQHNCEVLAGTVLAQLAQAGTPVMYGCVSAPMDLRNAEISQGNFETAMINAAAVQIADLYGMPSRISPGNTSDNKPCERAAVETAIGIYMGAASGGNFITTALLDSTLMVSYEHLVVVDELVRQVRSITKDLETDAESLAIETILANGHPSPDFLQSNHTLKLMNRDIYYSPFTGRIKESYQDWYERAHQRVTEILSRKRLEITGNPEIAERLRFVEARLKQNDKKWRNDGAGWWRFYIEDFCA